MEKFANYVLQEKIHETRNSIIYRGHKENESQPFIIKLLKTVYPTPSEIARFKQEYNLVKKLDIKNIIKIIDLVEDNNKYAIIEEDFGGVSLKDMLKTKPLGLKSFLQISSKVSETLGLIHKNNIIHLDIKPDNILINSELSEVKISDFGISAILTHANDELYNPDVIEGTLSYMSPEQTGRMNRGVDYRTDMYSLGATFYEMLTGEVPFKSKDPMELIHSHIARQPSSPSDLNTSIPMVLSAIILKLLSKNPEERYQNCLGLMADIDECLNQLTEKGGIDDFSIATKDISIRFNIPRSLVNREEEQKALMESFERVSNGASEIMLVMGQPGIGKSAVIHEIQKPIVAKNGYFILGKYDQFRKDVPYSAIIQSFHGLIRQIIAENEERIQSWKEKLLAALGPNGKVITDVIPDLELIIGKQPDLTSLGPEESQNRFNLVFQNFVNVFTTEHHPLALFLDDLQWADQASLKLLENIMTSYETKYFFMVGAYRDNEVSPSHPLTLSFDEIGKKGKNINRITIGPLDVNSINRIIMNALMCNAERSMPIAKLIDKKTAGNPFFVIQFLKSLYDNRLLELDPRTGWHWDIDQINKMQVTDNVVDFMAKKISSLPKNTQDILKICACIGNRFDLEMLSVVSGKSIEETLADLTSAVQEDLINLRGNLYRFHHDRIQEAAYSLIPDDEKAKMHYKIGNNVLKKTAPKDMNEKIFYVVDQLNKGISLVKDYNEKINLANLNLTAAVKAKESTAYAAAVSYLSAGIGLLTDESWKKEYNLIYALYSEQMECQYLNRNMAEAEKLFEIIIARALTKKDKAKAYNTMIVLYTNMRSPWDAIELGLKALTIYDIHISPYVGVLSVAIELIQTKRWYAKVPLEKLAAFPPMEDKDMIACLQLMLSVGTPAYYFNQNLLAKLALKGTNMALRTGHIPPYSAGAVIAQATIIQTALGDYELAYRLSEEALKLSEMVENRKTAGQVNHIFAFFIQHWRKHARYNLDFYRKAYQLSLDAGDFIYAGHSINASMDCRLMIGVRLDDILEQNKKYTDFMNIVKDPFIAARHTENNQLILNLKGQTDNRYTLSGPGYDEDAYIAQLRREKNFFGLCYTLLYKLKILYLYGKYEEARQIAAELEKHIKVQMGTQMVAEYYFYYSLILTALLTQGEPQRKWKFKAIIRRNQRKMHKWAVLCPENFRHKYDLVAAEMMAIKGCCREAQDLYHAAIEGARQNQYRHEEAMACERLALFYLSGSSTEEAMLFMQRAYRCYASWGASAKEQYLRECYPDLLRVEKNLRPADANSGTISLETASETLDMSTVMKVSQIISSEILLDRLLQKVMHMSIANAGAQRGYLILESDGKLTIEASEDVDKDEILVMQSMSLYDCTDICHPIVNYVHHSAKDVILGNAVQEGTFTNDPYIMRTQCKSILCTPIMNKGILTGILYMENNLTTDAFTQKRLEILRFISVQAAISIENAKLFELATTDGMTKLYVHRYFQLLLDQEIKRSRRHNKQFSLIMIDIDNFKSFNDTYGHQLGDKVLKDVANAIKKNIRSEDIAARYGGEEFVMILPETNGRQAMIAAEKVRGIVSGLEIPYESKILHVTISLGVATYPEHNENKEALIHAADEALYTSKHAGKNCVSLFEKKETPAED